MKYEYSNNYEINYSEVNPKLELGIVGTVELLENIVTDFYSSFGQGNYTIKGKFNSVWVYTKIKIKFLKKPKLKDTINAKSYNVKITPARTETETIISSNHEDIIIAKHETCVINTEKRKAVKLSTVNYPEDMNIVDSNKVGNFSKISVLVDNSDYIYSHKVQYTDIDFSKHTNNVMYVKHMINSFPLDFWMEKEINDFEIHYISETTEGEELKIYNKIDDNKIYFLVKTDEKEVAKAVISLK